MDDLGYLLDKYAEEHIYNESNNLKNGVFDSKQVKSDKGATLFDFIKMIDKVVKLTMEDLNVEFIPDEGSVPYLSSDLPLDRPLITYKLRSRTSHVELKPRLREIFEEDAKDSDRVGEIFGQKFKCIVQFNFFASEYKVVEQVMEKFEEVMLTYTGYFKKNGIGELIFKEQFTDDKYEAMRQTLSVRNLTYYVETEKVSVIMRESIKEIETY